MIYNEYASIVFLFYQKVIDLYYEGYSINTQLLVITWYAAVGYIVIIDLLCCQYCFYSSAAVNTPVIVVADNCYVWKEILCVNVWVLLGVHTCKDQRLVLCVFLNCPWLCLFRQSLLLNTDLSIWLSKLASEPVICMSLHTGQHWVTDALYCPGFV